MNEVRVTEVVAEVALSGASDLRVTEVVAEVALSGTSDLRVTEVVAEVALISFTNSVRATEMIAEVAILALPPTPSFPHSSRLGLLRPGVAPLGGHDPVQVGQELTYTVGIASAEAFGSGGIVALDGATLTGVTGIASAEAFGSGGTVVLVDLFLVGVTGIPSGEAFGVGIVAGPILGVNGIASEEAFGTGTLAGNTLTGSVGIPSEEAFGTDGTLGSIGGPLTGVTGIPSGEAFGVGIVAGPILGVSGIASAEAFGAASNDTIDGGIVTTLLFSLNGIPSEEAFGAGGALYRGVWGSIGIPSAEAFGNSGTVLSLGGSVSNFALYINGVNRSEYLPANTIKVDRQLNFIASSSLSLVDESGTFEPQIGQEVVIYFYDQTFTENEQGVNKPGSGTWERIFGGTIDSISIRKTHVSDSTRFLNIVLADYAKSVSRRILNMKYPAAEFGTLPSILRNIADRILTPEGISWIDRGQVTDPIPDLEFPYQPLNEVLDALTDAVGVQWMIDFYRNLYADSFPAYRQTPPCDITEETSGANGEVWRDLQVSRNRGLYRNVEYMKVNFPQTTTVKTLTYTCPEDINIPPGPYIRSWELVEAQPGVFRAPFFSDDEYAGVVNKINSIKLNGVEQPFFFQASPDATGENAPAGWKWMQIWERDLDLVYNMLSDTSAASWPKSGDVLTIEIEITNELPAPVMEENTVEIAARAAVEGFGTGRYEHVQDLPDISDRDLVVQYAQNLLARFSVMGLEIDFETDFFGFEPGQEVAVDLPSYGIDPTTLTVESVSYQEMSRLFLRHRVKLSNQIQQRDALAAFHRLIKRLRKPAKQEEVNIGFDIAKTLPGLINPGAVTGTSIGNPYIVKKKQIVLKDFSLYFKTPPTGADFVMTIRRNGSSLFSVAPTFTAGGTGVQVFSAFNSPPVTLFENDILTMDITQVGSTQPGKDGYGVLRGFA